MPRGLSKLAVRASLVAAALCAAASLASTGALAACAGVPSGTETKCKKAIQIPGHPLRSFDISWVDDKTHIYYLGDRSNAGIDEINAKTLKFVQTIAAGQFAGAVLNAAKTAVNNEISGPNGVVSFDRWLYAGDGNSTLKVIDLKAKGGPTIVQSIATGGTKRVDEMALTSDGKLLLAANNADDPTFATLFAANGKSKKSNVTIIRKYEISPSILPTGFGLSLEQPIWEPVTKRFYVSVPVIADNPTGCDHGQGGGGPACEGGMLVLDPTSTNTVIGAYSAATNTGVVPLHECAPNGIAVGPESRILEGCTPGNNPNNTTTLILSALDADPLFKFVNVGGITGSDEDWFDSGSNRYYLGANRNKSGAVLGVIDADTNLVIEGIPQSSGSHSVAADNKLNRIFVPQVAPASVVGSGGDTTNVGQNLCGSTNGCVMVFTSTAHHEE